jgi:hypothetical protein
MTFTEFIAVAAAAASILAAVLSYRSSKEATVGARRIASLNHQVAALDAEASQFRDDFRNFHAAVGGVQSLSDVGTLLAAGEVLQSNPRSSELLIETVDAIRGAVQVLITGATTTHRVTGGRAGVLPEEKFLTLRREFRGGLAAIAEERARVVAERAVGRRAPLGSLGVVA